MAAESLDLKGFDLVISSDSGPVKGVRVAPGAVRLLLPFPDALSLR
jgi:hypothetical protein